jgi:hypothetical protein
MLHFSTHYLAIVFMANMDDFDWKAILSSDSVLRVSNHPEDILELAGEVKVMPSANARAIDLILQDIERDNNPLELIRGLLALDLHHHGVGTLFKLSYARCKSLAEVSKLELTIRGILN